MEDKNGADLNSRRSTAFGSRVSHFMKLTYAVESIDVNGKKIEQPLRDFRSM
ncbi:hypothetical protein [Stieleria maiorica]|uniref:hypothetical protein n=1 Tax=Stieleria maiorica TaxID=2795974 RepID=UPI00142F2FD4|nr:hypothetical protein [Stieleria maiorica]